MDEELTGGYREPCGLCSAVDWGVSDEGRFYCKSCHDVIERTREVVDTSNFMMASTRISSVSKCTKNKKLEHGWEWMVCEGYQFILKHQAEAFMNLGVSSYFKDDVLCKFWRMYLQKSRLAYTNNPISTSRFKVRSQDYESDSAPESSVLSASEADEMRWTSETGSAAETLSDGKSMSSGSMDVCHYLTPHKRRKQGMMSMPKTLALCYLALLWTREAITLADLLRLVSEGCIPYINVHESFPEEMRVYGRDTVIFRVESIPSHRVLHKEASNLAVFLDLPPFPPITQDCLLHPSLLTIRYLAEVNLPDELHDFVCRVIQRAAMEDELLHSFKPMKNKCFLPHYDVQAAALILVTMKLLFRLDDRSEWDVANTASDMNKETPGENCFDVRKWYKTVESALTRARQRQEENTARKQWKSQKVLYTSIKTKPHVLKRRRISEQLQMAFQKLSGSSPSPPLSAPSSFCFRWGGEEDGAVDGPSMHQQNLGSLVVMRDGELQPSNPTYWHPWLRVCRNRGCGSHYDRFEATLPRMYVWLLQLFSFILNVQPSCVYEEVLRVERRFLQKSRSNAQKNTLKTPWKQTRKTCSGD